MHGSPAATVIGRRVEELLANRALAEEVARWDAELLATGDELPPMRQELVSASGEKRQYSARRLAVCGA